MIEVNNVSMDFSKNNDRITNLKEYLLQGLKGKIAKEKYRVLENITFQVKSGEVVGIIGKNGAGKSTLLKIISGILKPTVGNVKINGNIVPMLELGSGFDYDLTGKENIYLNGAILGYSKKYLDLMYDQILDFSGLHNHIDMPIRNYSSGMVMRLAFSIATTVNPEVLIVDEILAVGDKDFQEKSKLRMLEMMTGGTTVLFVSHNMSQIKELCNRVIWLEMGKIREIGSADHIAEIYERSN